MIAKVRLRVQRGWGYLAAREFSAKEALGAFCIIPFLKKNTQPKDNFDFYINLFTNFSMKNYKICRE